MIFGYLIVAQPLKVQRRPTLCRYLAVHTHFWRPLSFNLFSKSCLDFDSRCIWRPSSAKHWSTSLTNCSNLATTAPVFAESSVGCPILIDFFGLIVLISFQWLTRHIHFQKNPSPPWLSGWSYSWDKRSFSALRSLICFSVDRTLVCKSVIILTAASILLFRVQTFNIPNMTYFIDIWGFTVFPTDFWWNHFLLEQFLSYVFLNIDCIRSVSCRIWKVISAADKVLPPAPGSFTVW